MRFFFQTGDGGYVYFYVSIEFFSSSFPLKFLPCVYCNMSNKGSETRVSGPIPALTSPIRNYVVFMKQSAMTSPDKVLMK